jgi:Zn-dependent alcohol dehydrogenase
MRMIAAVMHEQGLEHPYAKSQPFKIEEIELDPPGPGEVLVEVRAAGLCHSDLSTVAGMRKRPLPVVGGHEGAGIVREIGAGVEGFVVGDHVTMAGVAGCGQCRFCLAQRPGLCQAVAGAKSQGMLGTGVRRLKSINGDSINHYSGISVYAQYAVVTPQSLIKIDKSVPLDIASLFGCAVITGAGAVFNSARVPKGSSVAVIGLGGVGLTAVMAAKQAGASRIIGIDLLDSKFGLAKTLGATECLQASDADIIQKVRDLTDGGVDFAFEISGHPSALEMAQAITVRGGEVVGVGVNKASAIFTVNHLPWVCDERVLRGSYMGGGVPQKDIPLYVEMYLKGQLPVDQLRSEHVSFDQLNAAFDRLKAGQTIRQILLPHGVV